MPLTAPTPYVTPDVLVTQPTGIAWSTLPGRGATQAENTAALYNICAQATAEIDEYLDVVLRATVNRETLRGPGDFRFQMRPDGTARLLLSSGPVVSVLGGKWSPSSSFPRAWTDLTAGDFDIEKPPLSLYSASASGSGEGGLAVFLRPGVASWAAGRQATLVQVQYISGWPHAGLADDATAGATSIDVDEVAAWMPDDVGATGVIYDGAGQEAVTVTGASATQGPGTLTLASPLTADHAADTLTTTMPPSIIWAASLFAAAEALTRGATATTVQQTPGTGVNASAGHEALRQHAREIISAYRRVV